MPQFELDTLGDVYMPRAFYHPRKSGEAPVRYSDLDDFTQGYIEALFFTESEPSTSRHDDEFTGRGEYPGEGETPSPWWHEVIEGQRKEIPGDYGFSDLTPESLALIIRDCATFQKDNAESLARAYGRTTPERERGDGTLACTYTPAWDYDESAAGRDLWFTRNGHGVGFWDREALEPDSAEYESVTAAMVAARDDNARWGELAKQRERLTAESLGARLTAACKAYGESNAGLTDAGQVTVD